MKGHEDFPLSLKKKFDDYNRPNLTRFDHLSEAERARRLMISVGFIALAFAGLLISACFVTFRTAHESDGTQCSCVGVIPWPVSLHEDQIGHLTGQVHHRWSSHQKQLPGTPFVVVVRSERDGGEARARLLIERFRVCGNGTRRSLPLLTQRTLAPPIPKCVVVLLKEMPTPEVLYHIHAGVVLFVTQRMEKEVKVSNDGVSGASMVLDL